MTTKTNLIHRDMHNQIVDDLRERLAKATRKNNWLEDKNAKLTKVVEAAREFSRRVFDYFHDEINDQSFIETADRKLAQALAELGAVEG